MKIASARAIETSIATGVFVVVFALCLVALEGITRVLDLAPPLAKGYGNNVPDPHLPYKPKPLSVITGRSSSNEFDFRYEHNSFGFRDVEHDTIETGKKTFKILGLGDSFTYGVGAPFDQTYLYRLEKMLNERDGDHPEVEVIKAGIPRYFPEPERILLQEYGLSYGPDLVLVGFVPNDVIDTYFGVEAVVVDNSGHLVTREAKEIGQLGKRLYERSHVIRLILKHYVAYRVSRKYRPQWDDVYRDGYHERDWQKIEEELAKIASSAHRQGIPVVLIHIPLQGPWADHHFYPPRRLASWARQHNVEFIDVLPAMMRYAEGSRLYYPVDGHCTPEGYRVIAETLFQYLIENRLAP